MYLYGDMTMGEITRETGCDDRNLRRWIKRWSTVDACLLNKHISEKLLRAHQPSEFEGRYKKPIATLVDGTAVKIETFRGNCYLKRATYCNKVKANAVQGLAWASACGLLLVWTSLFCGRLSETAMGRLHGQLLDGFPAGWARLVDRGFAQLTAAYKNLLQGYYPAFVRDGKISASGANDSKKQSQDRYVVETFFSRVKHWSRLSGVAKWAWFPYLEHIWVCALSNTDLRFPLRLPNNWDSLEQEVKKLKDRFTSALADSNSLPWFMQTRS